jgi:hypothetical protein
MTVITTIKLDYFCTRRESASQSDRAHRCLGARIDKAQLLDRWHVFADNLGQLNLGRRRRAKSKTPLRLLFYRLDNLCRGMTENERSPGADEIYVAVTVRVEDRASFATKDKERLATNGFPCPHGAVDAAGDFVQSATKKFFGSLCLHERVLLTPRRHRVNHRVRKKNLFFDFFSCNGF